MDKDLYKIYSNGIDCMMQNGQKFESVLWRMEVTVNVNVNVRVAYSAHQVSP